MKFLLPLFILVLLPALSASVPSWLYGKDWNLMKVTRRGVDATSENIEVECQYKFFYITIR